MHDHDKLAPGVWTWLQAWYATQCDGEWEHEFGIQIETVDNPGWSVSIDLGDTALSGCPTSGRRSIEANTSGS
ncbi:Imm53 family immunity protein [Micromonospora sp. CPCC 205714]